MKRQLLYGAAVAMMLAACSNNETEGLSDQPENAVAIRIGQSVEGVTARGVIENGSDVTATVLTAKYSAPYNASTWNSFSPLTKDELTGQALQTPANISTATFKAGTTTEVTLNPTLYYYLDNNTAIAAVAPAGNISGEKIDMKLTDGEQDVMYARSDGQAKPTGENTAITLTFSHKTTQLKFAFVMNSSENGAWTGKTVSVKSITIQNASVPQSVTFADGTVNFQKPGTNLDLPGVVAGNAVTTIAKSVGRPVMVDASSNILLDITLTVGDKDYIFSNVAVMGTDSQKLTTVIGSSHLITLTVTEPVTPTGAVEILTTATVEQWTIGGPGSGSLN